MPLQPSSHPVELVQGSWVSCPDAVGFFLFLPQGENHTNLSVVFTLG